jgi:alpha-glucoside transport system permease protein
MDRVIETLIGVVAAIGLSALVFIGINKLFDLTEKRFAIFNALVGGVSTAVVFGLLWGNRIIVTPALVTAIAVAIGTGAGFVLGSTRAPNARLLIGLGLGLGMGLLLGSSVRSPYWPSIDPVASLLGLAIGGGAGYLHWRRLKDRYSMRPVIFAWLALGWLFGGWLAADFDGTKVEALVVAAILGLLVGAWVGSVPHPDLLTRAHIADGSRKFIFAAPALFFIAGTLVVPLARTIWLGFLTGTPTNLRWNGLSNYSDIFSDPEFLNLSGWTGIFTSKLTWAAIILLVGGIGLGRWLGRSSGSGLGTGFSISAGTLTLLGGGAALLGFAIFVAIRGTISNNLWWIFSVIIFSISLGLGVAVLADRSKGENLAKSLIFLPMAISFVGASVIWRLMYIARPPQDQQTGVFNTLWVKLGELSNSPTASTIISVVLGLFVVGLLYLAWRGFQAGANSITAGSLVMTIPFLYLIYKFLGPGIGGFRIDAAGNVVADPVIFTQGNIPWNNFWLMVVFIWIQTGFAMVIFSAAIKAVPTELLEAARIDGATESQSFWRVTIPQIYPTIGVVVTTLIVTVLKVFDIPKVMTNGNFDTQVLANEMWQKAFTEFDFGTGSAVAVLLFIGVLPVMFINIRRMQKERLA